MMREACRWLLAAAHKAPTEADMSRLITAVAFIAATGAVPAASQVPEIDMRCVETDQALTERVRDLIARDDRRIAGTSPLHLVLTRMAAARFDCKRGRTERGLETYANIEAALQSIEETSSALTAQSGEIEPAR
jgi:hypothetical protein